MELNWYSKALILAITILGFSSLLIPSVLSEPNFLGVPTIPIALFAIALALYFLIKGHRKMFYATIVMLLILFGYTGFWAYNFKMPLSSLETSMQIYYYYIGPYIGPSQMHSEGNVSAIWFNLTIRNPTDIDTPSFIIENPAFYINNVKLKGYRGNWGHVFPIDFMGHSGYYNPHTIIKAHQTLTIRELHIFIFQNEMQVEEGNPEDVWEYLVSKNFTLSLSGTFTSRPNFTIEDTSRWSLWVLAESPFLASQRFTESPV